MTHHHLVEQFLANGGTVTVCPPRTFSQDAASPAPHWRDIQSEQYRIAAAKRRMAAAVETADKYGHITADRLRGLINANGVTAAANELGMCRKTLLRLAKQRGVTVKMRVMGLTAEMVRQKMLSGMTIAQISAETGSPEDSVRRRLNRAGWKVSDITEGRA